VSYVNHRIRSTEYQIPLILQSPVFGRETSFTFGNSSVFSLEELEGFVSNSYFSMNSDTRTSVLSLGSSMERQESTRIPCTWPGRTASMVRSRMSLLSKA